jgi:outer membrane immunogenic protein
LGADRAGAIIRDKLISSIAGTAFILAASGSAFAATPKKKTPPLPPPAPVYRWTGWYVGVNAGAGFGHANTDFGGSVSAFGVQTPDSAFSDGQHLSGFIGGGQIGYNWQYSPLIVVGLEADIQSAFAKDTINNTSSQPLQFETAVANAGGLNAPGKAIFNATVGPTSYTTQIDWFGTVRARVGYVWWNGEVMSYLTGGLAYGGVKISGASAANGIAQLTDATGSTDALLKFSVNEAFSSSSINPGWVVGLGTEGRIDFWGASNWTWKVEGLYMDLGTLDSNSATPAVVEIKTLQHNPPTTVTGNVTTHSNFTDGILRAGLNYQFH